MTTTTPAQELAAGGSCLFPTVGDSMRPLLHTGRTLAAVQAADGALRRYDIALYRRPDGQYVLHRVVKVLPDGYLTRGDARRRCEEVPRAWVLGVMTGYYDGARYTPCQSLKYRCFVHLWCDTPLVRGAYLLLHRRKHG